MSQVYKGQTSNSDVLQSLTETEAYLRKNCAKGYANPCGPIKGRIANIYIAHSSSTSQLLCTNSGGDESRRTTGPLCLCFCSSVPSHKSCCHMRLLTCCSVVWLFSEFLSPGTPHNWWSYMASAELLVSVWPAQCPASELMSTHAHLCTKAHYL